jgi:hypothetical protein
VAVVGEAKDGLDLLVLGALLWLASFWALVAVALVLLL